MRIVPHWLPKVLRVHAIAIHTDLVLCVPARAPGGDSEDPALWAHEREHCEQMAEMGTVLWWLAYVLNPWFRLRCEILAYRVQIAHTHAILADSDRERFARFISPWFPYLLPLGWKRATRLERARQLLGG